MLVSALISHPPFCTSWPLHHTRRAPKQKSPGQGIQCISHCPIHTLAPAPVTQWGWPRGHCHSRCPEVLRVIPADSACSPPPQRCPVPSTASHFCLACHKHDDSSRAHRPQQSMRLRPGLPHKESPQERAPRFSDRLPVTVLGQKGAQSSVGA